MQTIKMQIYAMTRTTREVMVLLAMCNRFIATTAILGKVQMENSFSKGSM